MLSVGCQVGSNNTGGGGGGAIVPMPLPCSRLYPQAEYTGGGEPKPPTLWFRGHARSDACSYNL